MSEPYGAAPQAGWAKMVPELPARSPTGALNRGSSISNTARGPK